MKTLIFFIFTILSFHILARSGSIEECIQAVDTDETLNVNAKAIAKHRCGFGVRASLPGLDDSGWKADFATSQTSSVDANPLPSNTDVDNNKICKPSYGCAAQYPLVKEYSDFIMDFNRFSQLSVLKENCECFKNFFQEKLGDDYQKKIDEAKQTSKEKVLEALSRKFINDFSANLEDASFFLTNNSDVLPESEDARYIQCLDIRFYDEKINAKCTERGLTDKEFIEKRKNFLVNSLEKTNIPFAQKLQEISHNTLSIPYPVTSGPFAGKTYTRFEYDKARLGLAHSDPRVKAVDHLLKKFLSMRGVSEDFNSLLAGTSPVSALITYIENNKYNSDFMRKLNLDSAIVGDLLKDTENLKQAFRFAINTHPGMMNVMEDEDAFFSLKSAVKNFPDKSILEIIEKNKDVTGPVIESRCNDIANDLANAVCTRDEDLLGSMRQNDLSLLLNPPVDEKKFLAQIYIEPDMAGLLSCQTKQNEYKFNNLAALYSPLLPAKRADYLERILNPDVSKHQNMFSKTMLASMTEKAANEIHQAASIGLVVARPSPAQGVLAAKVYAEAVVEGKISPLSKPLMSKAVAKKFLDDEKTYQTKLAQKEIQKKSPEAVSESNSSTVAPKVQPDSNKMATPQPVKLAGNGSVSSREQFNKYLAQNNRPEDVKQETSKLSDSNIDELSRLRNQNLDLLQKNFEMEQKRLEGIQDRIEGLQKKISTPESVVNQKIEKEELPEKRASLKPMKESPVTKVVEPGKEPGKVFSPEEVTNGRGNIDKAVKPESSSLTLKKVSGVEGDTSHKQMINEEVQKLLETDKLDQTSVEEMMANGIKIKIGTEEILVKFQDLDQKTRDLIELKFAKKERDQQISKLAVLRMLMGRHQK